MITYAEFYVPFVRGRRRVLIFHIDNPPIWYEADGGIVYVLITGILSTGKGLQNVYRGSSSHYIIGFE